MCRFKIKYFHIADSFVCVFVGTAECRAYRQLNLIILQSGLTVDKMSFEGKVVLITVHKKYVIEKHQ